MTSALATPSYQDLLAVMSNQRRLLEQLLFRHAEISMLIAAGEHRFVGRAIDEAFEVETDLGATELMRAMVAAALEPIQGDPSLSELIASAPADIGHQLNKVATDMTRLISEVDRYRKQASEWAGDRATQVAQAVAGFGANTYSAGRPGS
jgi:hypothetical protein